MSAAETARPIRPASAWLFRLSWLYLSLPWLLFVFGWLRPWLALLTALITLLALWQSGKDTPPSPPLPRQQAWSGIVLLGVWVFLSGIGGYAFQNWDHHWRNAVFHDLITYRWPVTYVASAKGPVQMLVYYLGYWLPAALAGKRWGWGMANAALFLWTWAGVTLAGWLLASRLRWPLWKAGILLIFFSGLDVLGVLLHPAGDYPSLWPPIQHLETWAGDLQYSSFTTQLFWVFNQAVPAWIGTALLLNGLKRRQMFLLWALIFFFAPLAAAGLLPLLLVEFLRSSWQAHRQGETLRQSLAQLFSLPNLSGMWIALLTLLYFSANTAAQNRTWQPLAPADWLIFFSAEAGLFWAALAQRQRGEAQWYVAGGLLLIFPFIQIGYGRDFVMRASIPSLFYLMVWVAEAISSPQTARPLRLILLVFLGIGMLTPLYEINRSIYRTVTFYASPPQARRLPPDTQPITHLRLDTAPEADHPGTLVADRIGSLGTLQDKLSKNFIANVRKTFFYRFLVRH
jgi:hypothetical protein